MPTPAVKPRLSRETVVLGIIAFFVMVGFGVVIPVLPVFIRSFHVGYIEVGAVVSAFALARFVASPFVGKLIAWGGERTILATGIGIVAVSSAMVGLAQTYIEVLVLRGAGGIGSAMFSISAMSLLLGSTPPDRRGRAVGFYQGGFLIGGMAGPALGGLLAVISLRAPFFFYAGTLVVAGVVGLLFLRPVSKGAVPDATAAAPIPFRAVLMDERFRAACIANFASGWASLGVRSALVPILVVELLHQEELWTGIAFAIAAVAQTLALGPAGTFVDKVGRKPAIIGSYSVAAAVMLAIPFTPNITVLIILLSVFGMAAAFMGTAPAAAVGDAAGAKSGQPVAVFSAISDLGAIVGPLAAGALLDSVSYPAAFGSAVILLAVAALYALRMPGARAAVAG
ncbi:MFS family permease [Cryobacterium mesophilum]|uniref:MFS transporter n=1 Tax=Terrimesophilobacter mesophilus TaxID=433647 RepID=A0A4R8VAL8_9MICO|nr:MFS transporter [Terrimesophilobacter mesophilus]MBB5632213.1 MFS family permease [Terrimesophilobacter mesophilus]TFB79072.1 MFS transporter [Terrimesophilobacter mesophilus]